MTLEPEMKHSPQQPSTDEIISIVANSREFDVAHYQQFFKGTESECIRHFVTEGVPQGYTPNTEFDCEFYLKQYEDVAAAQINPFVHWITSGRQENRYPNALAYEIGQIQNSGLFDSLYYIKNNYGNPDAQAHPIKHYLLEGWKNNCRPREDFDPRFYATFYDDLRNFNFNPFVHYIMFGRAEGRIPNAAAVPLEFLIRESGYFDEDYYCARVDVPENESPIAHFLSQPNTALANPSAQFECAFYLEQYADVAESGTNPFVHWISFGRAEGRYPTLFSYEKDLIEKSDLFDTEYYMKTYPDVGEAQLDPITHFITDGCKEGRRPALFFDPIYYAAQYEDVRNYSKNPFVHFIEFGREEHRRSSIESSEINLIQQSDLFDEEYYVSNNPDVLDGALPPAAHYYYYGWEEGRNPSEKFISSNYLILNPDVCKTESNPLVHYLKYGRKENRRIHLSHKDQALLSEENIEALQDSPYFNSKYYLSRNHDVADAKVDPIKHYLVSGWNEGRNPCKSFFSSYYLKTYSDVRSAKTNPLLHYIKYGKSEGRRINNALDVSTLFQSLDTRNTAFDLPLTTKDEAIADVILPVYNGYGFLEILLPQLQERTNIPFRLIIVNDASPDPRIGELINQFAQRHANVEIITNKQNKGFVKSVNEGLRRSTKHVVLLNSDVELPSNWLARLLHPILIDPTIASVTPMTNAGTIASFPFVNKDNEIIGTHDVQTLDEIFQRFDSSTYFECPTGVGFCMALNKGAISRVGHLDDETFEKGYGEENDWCQRAMQEGFTNVIIPNLFVWHKHGGSFTSAEKEKLLKSNFKKLLKKHPHYMHDVSKYMIKDPLEPYRFWALIQAVLKDTNEATTLIFDHNIGGGANAYRQKMIEEQKDQNSFCMITYLGTLDCFQIRFFHKEINVVQLLLSQDDLENFLDSIDIGEIFYNSIFTFPEPVRTLQYIERCRQSSDCRLTITLHDYLPICLSHTLLNNKDVFCGPENNPDVCAQCVQTNSRYEDKTISTIEWRSAWKSLLSCASRILTFSAASRDILLRAYPEIPLSKTEVRPHTLPFEITTKPILIPNRELNIGVIGTILSHKGASIVKGIVEYLESQKEGRVTVIGTIGDVDITSERLTVTGQYNAKDLSSIIEANRVNVFLFPSIWPETFSYVTDEVIQMNAPLAVFDIGAPPERVGKYAQGAVLPTDASAETIVAELQNLKTEHVDSQLNEYIDTIRSSELFDKQFYLDNNPDVAASGVDPAQHYALFGGREGRDPCEKFHSAHYIESYPDVLAAEINPLYHYIKKGQFENRLTTRTKNTFILTPHPMVNPNRKIAVVIHGYYEDLIEELLNATTTIPIQYDILISVVSDAGIDAVNLWKKHPRVKKLVVKKVPNRGRDIGPAFVHFAQEIRQYDLVCKIHTKKSLYTGNEQTVWRKHLVNNLLGKELYVRNILHQFETDEKLGLMYPFSDLLPYWAYSWLSNKPTALPLQNKIQVELPLHGHIDYPMGSMLWFRPAALSQLLDGRFTDEDFPEEPCGNDGTFAHAIERAFTFVAKSNGFEYVEFSFLKNMYFRSPGLKNMNQYAAKTSKELLQLVESKEIISFDIFDTLISRPLVTPDDLFQIMEKELNQKYDTETYFLKERKAAEHAARQKLQKDVSYSDIYREMKVRGKLPKNIVEDAQEQEFQHELQLCRPRTEMRKVYDAALEQNKRVILTSDMYLHRTQIEQMLTKCEFQTPHALYISSTIDARKDQNKMWDHLIDKEGITRDNFIHIGDNEHSDIQLTTDRGFTNYHVMSATNMFLNSELGIKYLAAFGDAWKTHRFLGPAIEKLYNNPFIANTTQARTDQMLTNPADTGYAVIGPIILHFMNWICQQATKDNVDCLYFLAREGYFLKSIYDHFIQQDAVKKKYGQLPPSKYLLISRRTVIGAAKKTPEDIDDIIKNNHFKGTLRDLLYFRMGFDINLYDESLGKTEVQIPRDFEKVRAAITDYHDQIIENAKLEQEGLMVYLDEIEFLSKDRIGLVDVGYSGTIQRYLHQFTQKHLRGYFFVTRDDTRSWNSPENSTIGCFEDGAVKSSQTPVFKFNLYLECWLTSPDGQLASFSLDKSRRPIPNFLEKEKAKSNFEINEKITHGVKNYISDTLTLSTSDINALNINKENAQKIFEQCTLLDLWDSETRKIAFLEDNFCGNNELDVIGDYKRFVIKP